MSHGLSDDHCFLCDLGNSRTSPNRPWYDWPIFVRPGVGTAVVSVGALINGYLLVAPDVHVSSVCVMSSGKVRQFLSFLDAVLRHVEVLFGACTIFEHGSCPSEGRRRSACVTHAHIHIIPGIYRLSSLELPIETFPDLVSMANASSLAPANGYLMYREPGGPVCCSADIGVPQYFRRHIAAALGCYDEWDYALFPRWETVRATQEALLAIADAGSDRPKRI